MKPIRYEEQAVDVAVIGAGHAGCEAALAASRMGLKTLLITMHMSAIADLPCNPNIGGTGKGHLVREIDALGGEMALNTDRSFLQSRMLNTSKGPAIHSLRVQTDKTKYHTEMKKVLENQENLLLIQAEVIDIEIDDNRVRGLLTKTGAYYPVRAIIIATGTYLQGLILIGELQYAGGPNGLSNSTELSDSLRNMGIPMRRFKTGTPARVHRNSCDVSKMEIQKGDTEVIPFSFLNMGKLFDQPQLDCFLTYTTEKTKEIIEANLHRSPMYSGTIEGIGPRYCPSIEDKVVRFPDRDQHQVFLEPEGLDTAEMYVQGVSTTLPEEVQKNLYRSIIGLEHVHFMRSAYGIEYDCIDPTILKRTLEHKTIHNLFFAGQINGSSGYEEAAAQGLIAGINAVCNIKEKEPFVLDRADAYIGVLIDDLVTKGTNEPYRMMTSRAEYRLILRQDNADLRLTEKGYVLGLVSEKRYQKMLWKKGQIEEEKQRLKRMILTPKEEVNLILKGLGTSELRTAISLYDLIKRPELQYEMLGELDPHRPKLQREIRLQVETQIKYEGYIIKQTTQIESFKKYEKMNLNGIDYGKIRGLSTEAVQKLSSFQPDSVGQASRISGVSPADITVLLIYLETKRRGHEIRK